MALPNKLANLYDAFSRVEFRFDARPEAPDCSQEGSLAAISKPNPDEARIRRPCVGEVEEVFILADEHATFGCCVRPNRKVGGVFHADIEYMLSLVAEFGEETRECGWKLVVDQNLHDA